MHIAIVGANGGVGNALVELLSNQAQVQSVHAFARGQCLTKHAKVDAYHIDITDEANIINAIGGLPNALLFDRVIVATGFLHDANIQPEKSLSDISKSSFDKHFRINTIGPMLVAKHFLPRMNRDNRAIFGVLSARVGSIGDNRLGGWYAYRASKAALNMCIKNMSIEAKRQHPKLIIAGLHPGTVDTKLSQPFQSRVPSGKLFTPEQSARYLLAVIENLKDEDSGGVFAWDGQPIQP